jgi:hypothetical protein
MSVLRSIWNFVYDFFAGDAILLVGVVLTVALTLILAKVLGPDGVIAAAPVLVVCVILVLVVSLAGEVRARR